MKQKSWDCLIDNYGLFYLNKIINEHEKIQQEKQKLQNKLDKIEEYAVDRINNCDRLYSNQNNLEKVIADYGHILSIIESESGE